MEIKEKISSSAAWLAFIAIFTISFLFIYNPLPGGFFLIISWAIVSIFIAPITHIVIKRKNIEYSHLKTALIVFGILVIIFLIMASSGVFNFT